MSPLFPQISGTNYLISSPGARRLSTAAVIDNHSDNISKTSYRIVSSEGLRNMKPRLDLSQDQSMASKIEKVESLPIEEPQKVEEVQPS